MALVPDVARESAMGNPFSNPREDRTILSAASWRKNGTAG
jgi:hypothetical protein